MIFFVKCNFEIEFENNSTAIIKINYQHNKEYYNIKNYLLYYIDSSESAGYKFKKIKRLNIDTTTCLCNIAYEHYIKRPNPMIEWKINMILARNLHLINKFDRTKNHPWIRKYSYIPFNL